ncbi:restriction endonuclease subunit S [Shewanella cyperi]|uniref:restriction endonuclease subunit S n=1 Tax=Shewanella cyperi TaxID=2814292 RepID=UPI001A948979|nr:restriction endonuclease subunit S [Shewanella cyperi]QSX39779.1 restriction endonuclease subunit S [Shewanella cyperi]
MSVEKLITASAMDGVNVDHAGAIIDHIDIWTSAIQAKSASGRGSGKKIDLYGIKKLRELILELAVRGKLVPQDPTDEPASELLERIAAEKAQLVKEGKVKKPKALPEIGEDEKPFALPEGWEWCHFQSLSSYIQRGKGPSYADCGVVKVVSQKCIQWSGFDISQARFIEDSSLGGYQEERFLQSGDLLWNSTGTGTVGRINVLKDTLGAKIVADSHVTVIRPLGVSSDFLKCYVAAPGIQSRIEPDHEKSLVSGSTKQVELNTSSVLTLLLPVPPLEEQHRIVAKVEELMALCDQLEQQTEASIEAHQQLVTVLLDSLINSAADDFMANWARISDHFDTLFTTEASIDALKQTILQLAVMGKLVPQASREARNSPDYEPAAKLLERIAAEKARLVKEKKIKKDKPLPAITEDEKPFPIPEGWAFAYMQDLCSLITDGTHQTPKYTDRGRPFVSAQCVKPFRFMPEFCRYVSEEHYQLYIKSRKPEFGDILLSRVGAGIGEAAVIDTDLEFAIYVSTGLLKPHRNAVYSKYLAIWLNSPIGRGFSERNTLGKGVSQGNLNLSLIRSFLVSFPPQKEQKAIVAKVDELMAICDQLKQRLSDSQQTQLKLTDAILEQHV